MPDDLPLIAQVSNVSTLATLDQMEKLFGFMGKIKDIRMYPTLTVVQPQFKVCYIKYAESWSVRVALHLTNTVFIDRALVVVAIPGDTIPSEDSTTFDLLNPVSALPGLLPSNFKDVSNDIAAVDGNLVITSIDTNLDILGLPQYPPLSADQDPNTIEEIRRTVFVESISPQVTASQLLDFINNVVGEVKYLRMAGHDKSMAQSAYVEFTDRTSIVKALQCDGITLKGSKLKIQHSSSAIVKPTKDGEVISEKDNEEAMRRLKEAESLIARVVEPEISGKASRSRRRSTSRSRRRSSSRSRRRSRSISRRSSKRDKRSRSKDRRRRSTSRRRRTRSRSKVRRSRSRSKPRRSRSRSKTRRSKRSYSRSRRSRSKRSASKGKTKRLKSKSRSPHSRRKGHRSRSRSNADHSKRKRSRSRSITSKRRSRSRSGISRSKRSRSRSKAGSSKGSKHSKSHSSPKKERSRSRSKVSASEIPKSISKIKHSRSRSQEPAKHSDDESKREDAFSSTTALLSCKELDNSFNLEEGDNILKVSEDSQEKASSVKSSEEEDANALKHQASPYRDVDENNKKDRETSRSRSRSKTRTTKKSETSSPGKEKRRLKDRKGTRSPVRNIRRRHYSSSSSSSPTFSRSRDKKSSRRRSRSPRRSRKHSSKRSLSPLAKRSSSPLKRSKRSTSRSKYHSHDSRRKSRRSVSRSPARRSKSRSPRHSIAKDVDNDKVAHISDSE